MRSLIHRVERKVLEAILSLRVTNFVFFFVKFASPYHHTRAGGGEGGKYPPPRTSKKVLSPWPKFLFTTIPPQAAAGGTTSLSGETFTPLYGMVACPCADPCIKCSISSSTTARTNTAAATSTTATIMHFMTCVILLLQVQQRATISSHFLMQA